MMIIDDAAFMRLSIRRMVENNDYEIIAEGSDGLQAIELYKEHRPDITTLDITMPNMNGIEALKAIRSIDGNAKIIMVSAMGQENLIREAVMNGASSFLVKPFQKDKLLEVLDSICNK